MQFWVQFWPQKAITDSTVLHIGKEGDRGGSSFGCDNLSLSKEVQEVPTSDAVWISKF